MPDAVSCPPLHPAAAAKPEHSLQLQDAGDSTKDNSQELLAAHRGSALQADTPASNTVSMRRMISNIFSQSAPSLPRRDSVQSPNHSSRSGQVKGMAGLESALLLTHDKLVEDGGKVVLYEFQRQKQKTSSCYADATHPDNDNRNRYSDVLAFDDTRVHLQSHNGSDYINASHLTSRPGEEPSWHIIATQGPLPSTIEHFWQMVWEQRTSVIVMLTCCVENSHVKCADYFAEDAGKAIHSGALRIDTASVHAVDSDITLRELLITPRNNPTAPPRRARHYHYHAWPDRSVPTQALSLRRLSRKLADRISASHAPGAADADGPPVVHCSAGIGRTGVLCTLVVALLRLRAVEATNGLACRQAVSVKRIVASLRKQRSGMVQTFEQYRFCYECIKEELQEQLGQLPVRLERPSTRS